MRHTVIALLLVASASSLCVHALPGALTVTRVRIETTQGAFVVETNSDWAPRGTDRFLELVRSHFFDDSRFFRVRECFFNFAASQSYPP